MTKTLTPRYTLNQMAYWAAAAGIMSFASAFLLSKGFAPSMVGVLLASGNLLSCVLQPILADRADRAADGNILPRLCIALTALCALFFGSLLFLPVPQWLYGLLYLLGIFTFDAMTPLMNSISVAYSQQGFPVNYGFGRGIGSLAFSLAALAIGWVMAEFGADWMLWLVLVLLLLNGLIILGYPTLEKKQTRETAHNECCSLAVFFVRYKWYCFSLLGVLLLAMFHAMTENYLIEVFAPLGGDSGSVGVALFIATLIEMPVLIYFTQVHRRLGHSFMLKVAGLSFLLKSFLLLWAPSVTAIYAIELLQATSYAFLSPTQLYYANDKIDSADMVKGQAFITASYTLGCAIGNFIGGQLLEFFHVHALLLAGVGMAAAGTLILFLTVDKRDR